ncbi:MAG: hypothetical protein ACOZNI_19355 [Myxococcota bacterium]
MGANANEPAERSFEVVSWLLVGLVGLSGVAVAAMFGLPAGLALVVLAAIVGVLVWARYVQHGGGEKAGPEP